MLRCRLSVTIEDWNRSDSALAALDVEMIFSRRKKIIKMKNSHAGEIKTSAIIFVMVSEL